MNRNETKEMITASYESATPDVLDRILKGCKEVEQVEIATFYPKKTRKHITRQVMAAVASLCLICGLGFAAGRATMKPVTVIQTGTTSEQLPTEDKKEQAMGIVQKPQVATLYLDVNPSIKLAIDEDQKVISCTALNEDAQPILEDVKVEGFDTELAIQTLVGALYIHGYLKDDTAAILISVDTQEEDYKTLAETINASFESEGTSIEVVLQKVDTNTWQERADANSISVGKMEFVDRIIEESMKYSSENEKELASYTIKTLLDIFHNRVVDDNTQTASDENQSTPSTQTAGSTSVEDQIKPAGGITDAAGNLISGVTDAAGDLITSAGQTADDVTGLIPPFIEDLEDALKGAAK